MVVTVIILVDNRGLPLILWLIMETGDILYSLALSVGGKLFLYAIDILALVIIFLYILLYFRNIFLKGGITRLKHLSSILDL